MAAPAALQRSVVSPAGRHTASLIFLHGSGDTGQGARAWIKQILNQDMAFQHIKVIYPTAPARPYTPMKGAFSNVWFDRYKICNDCPEHIESIDSMCRGLTDLINDEVKNGIAKSRILIGGFSMGGGMAMHLAFRFHQDLAGVFALSSFLNKDSAVYQEWIWDALSQQIAASTDYASRNISQLPGTKFYSNPHALRPQPAFTYLEEYSPEQHFEEDIAKFKSHAWICTY
ncbi:lysophospholipase-like protein 1 isoform X2 [Haemorhous mexicanus]|uniref:lysophospholipase-like protein 1 isoform X2 n=1 Tax=Haemorhous mexicanus TaxID=30427 RepID=UPI0028BEF9CB|nr:lysophospholipase-like protein 1 isoform X2 [Haemorhous mexicanus]